MCNCAKKCLPSFLHRFWTKETLCQCVCGLLICRTQIRSSWVTGDCTMKFGQFWPVALLCHGTYAKDEVSLDNLEHRAVVTFLLCTRRCLQNIQTKSQADSSSLKKVTRSAVSGATSSDKEKSLQNVIPRRQAFVHKRPMMWINFNAAKSCWWGVCEQAVFAHWTVSTAWMEILSFQVLGSTHASYAYGSHHVTQETTD